MGNWSFSGRWRMSAAHQRILTAISFLALGDGMMDFGDHDMSTCNTGLKPGNNDAHFHDIVTNVGNNPIHIFRSGSNDSPGAADAMTRSQFHFWSSSLAGVNLVAFTSISLFTGLLLRLRVIPHLIPIHHGSSACLSSPAVYPLSILHGPLHPNLRFLRPVDT